MDSSFLEGIGFTRNESIIYISLLKLGSSTTGNITYESKLHMSRVYEGLNRLMSKGLVSSVKQGNITRYQATNPEKILDYLEEEKTNIQKKQEEVKKQLPDLLELTEKTPKAEAQVLLGLEGFKAMRRDVLRHAKGELLLIGAIGIEDERMPVFFSSWNKQRIKQGIKLKILYKRSAKGRTITTLPLTENKYLPKEVDNPAVINIYGDRIVNLLWKDNYPILFLLVNRDIADSYRKYFQLLWKISRK